MTRNQFERIIQLAKQAAECDHDLGAERTSEQGQWWMRQMGSELARISYDETLTDPQKMIEAADDVVRVFARAYFAHKSERPS
jgi:hypothetical protein